MTHWLRVPQVLWPLSDCTLCAMPWTALLTLICPTLDLATFSFCSCWWLDKTIALHCIFVDLLFWSHGVLLVLVYVSFLISVVVLCAVVVVHSLFTWLFAHHFLVSFIHAALTLHPFWPRYSIILSSHFVHSVLIPPIYTPAHRTLSRLDSWLFIGLCHYM